MNFRFMIYLIFLTISLTYADPIYFVTGNINKFNELKAIIPELEQLNIDLVEIQEMDARKVIEAKLNEAAIKHKGKKIIVEDTSLYLDGLNGLPGPLIKWFMQTIGNQGIYKLANCFENRKAQAKAIIGYMDENGKISYFEGVVNGRITPPRTDPGKKAFGWDPIFSPEGYKKTFAQMSMEEKNKLSMRAQAGKALQNFLFQEQVQQTFAMIKPDATQFEDKVISMIENNGFKIIKKVKKQLSKQEAQEFYQEHKARPFFGELIDYITSGPVIGFLLEKKNAVGDWRTLAGATDPQKAQEGTIRKLYGKDKLSNAVHGSDSVESAKREIKVFFK